MPWGVGDCPIFVSAKNGTVPLVAIFRAAPVRLHCSLLAGAASLSALSSVGLRATTSRPCSAFTAAAAQRGQHIALARPSATTPSSFARQRGFALDLTERGLDVASPAARAWMGFPSSILRLHFTAAWASRFFEEWRRMSNALEPDLVAITGGHCRQTPLHRSISGTLGRLKARYGVYYIFGTTTSRVDWENG